MLGGKYMKDHITFSKVRNIKCKRQKCKCEYVTYKNFFKHRRPSFYLSLLCVSKLMSILITDSTDILF